MSAMTEKQKMLAGELYLANDPELFAAHKRALQLTAEFNRLSGENFDELRAALKPLLGHMGEDVLIKPVFKCDYGFNISMGDRSFVNFNCVFLDCNTITIGKEVKLGPGVHIYTATHPLDPDIRRAGPELALPVTIGDGAWLGGGSIICPGVTIGSNTVVGAGSVVTKDLPANVLAVGNPARVIRNLEELPKIPK